MTQDRRGLPSLERVTTGIPALDQILEGGIPKYSIVFVAGAPGTGKSVLCQQALFENARNGTRVLYLATLAEPVVKMVRHIQGLSFFHSDMVGSQVIYGE